MYQYQAQTSNVPMAAAGIVIAALAFLIVTAIGFKGSIHF